MLCLNCSRARLLNIPSRLSEGVSREVARRPLQAPQSLARSFSALSVDSQPLKRPSTSPNPCAVLKSPFFGHSVTSRAPTYSIPSFSSVRNFSATAALGVKRDTFNPSRRVQKRRHGFLSRTRTRAGRNNLARRRSKSRKHLSW